MDREDPSAIRTEQPDRHADFQATFEMQSLIDSICRFELFLLGDGEKKVTEEGDTRKRNPSMRSPRQM